MWLVDHSLHLVTELVQGFPGCAGNPLFWCLLREQLDTTLSDGRQPRLGPAVGRGLTRGDGLAKLAVLDLAQQLVLALEVLGSRVGFLQEEKPLAGFPQHVPGVVLPPLEM